MTSWADAGLHRYGAGIGWGWVVYRTVYTAESDEIWEETLEKIKQACFAEYDFEIKEPEADRTRAKNLYSYIVMDDRALLENASMDVIRNHFLQWLDENEDRDSIVGENTKLKHPLVIDEDCLRSIKQYPDVAPSPRDVSDDVIETSFVKIVDMEYSADDSSWEGWMYASIYSLFTLWILLVEEDLKYHAKWVTKTQHHAWSSANEPY